MASHRRHVCPFCFRGFYSATGLRLHLNNDHDDDEDSGYEIELSPTRAVDDSKASEKHVEVKTSGIGTPQELGKGPGTNTANLMTHQE